MGNKSSSEEKEEGKGAGVAIMETQGKKVRKTKERNGKEGRK